MTRENGMWCSDVNIGELYALHRYYNSTVRVIGQNDRGFVCRWAFNDKIICRDIPASDLAPYEGEIIVPPWHEALKPMKGFGYHSEDPQPS